MDEFVFRSPAVEVSVASRPLKGHDESGDASFVGGVPGGTLLAVIDGLGHGTQAASASRLAVTTLGNHAGETLERLILRCHESLRNSRGAVMTLALINERDATLTWTGVGNVEGRLLRSWSHDAMRDSDAPMLLGGVVGHRLPLVHPSTTRLRRGDVIVLITDGIDAVYSDSLRLEGTPSQMSQWIMTRHHKEHDDALVLVARYLGAPA